MGKCPVGCFKEGADVLGIGVHPEDSAICRSAIYDGSMPFHGGVIGVGITPGLQKYFKGRSINGITANGWGKSDRSFYTMRIDNIDMAKSNVRIVDHEGLNSYVGRLEVRS